MVKEQISQAARCFSWLLACLFSVAFIEACFAAIGFFLIIFGLPFLALTFAFMVLFHGYKGVRSAIQASSIRGRIVAALAAPAMALATVFLAPPSLWAGNFTGVWVRLIVNINSYEAFVEQVRVGQARDGNEGYLVDKGPPVRVAFYQQGFLSNWSGIIFDPTGDVMQADGIDPKTGKFRAPERITKLFEGDLMSCRHLMRRYYYCSFT